MTHPNGPLLRVLAERVRANLNYIDKAAPKWDPQSPDRDREPFTDTQLLISTLGFLVFPHERTQGALGRLLKKYDEEFKLSDVMTVLYPDSNAQQVEIASEDGLPVRIDPAEIEDLPRLLRNSIAHFNVRPIGTDDGRFRGVRVWNKDLDGNITFVADLEFDQLRKLADFVLTSFSGGGNALKDLDDPEDPLEVLKNNKREAAKPKIPKLIQHQWEAALKLNNGDPAKAKEWIDRVISAAIRSEMREKHQSSLFSK